MLHKSKSKKINQLKYALVFPALLGFLISCNSELKENNPDNLNGTEQTLPIKVVGVGNNLGNDPIKVFIVDGKEKTVKEVENLDPNNIHSVTVSKDENVTKKYGDKGKNGVVEIITKENAKSFEGKPTEVKVTGYGTMFDSTKATIKIGHKIEINKHEHPLVIVDGKELPYEKMGELNHDTVESIKMLKDETTIKKYGDKAKNGVLKITTKK